MESIENSNKVIRLSKSCLSNEEKQAVIGVLDRGFLGMGEEVQQFEAALTGFFGRSVVCVVNGTAALHLALQGAGIGDGDEVLVQSLTYVASFQAISATGAKPVACDVDVETLCLDWRDAEKRLTANTKAVMPVHYAGGVGALDEVYEFANKHGLRVIEDAAHAIGSEYKGSKIGSFGDIACFSFDGIKNITSGEGGCVVTDDQDVLQKIKDARLLGVEKDTENRYSGGRSWNFNVSMQGWRYHMSNIMAAIGLEQLKKNSEFVEKRRMLAKCYDEQFRGSNYVSCFYHDYDEVAPHIYAIRIKGGFELRKGLQEYLLKHGVQTGVHYQPNHWLSLYESEELYKLPITEQVYSELLSLPLHPELSKHDIKMIGTLLGDFFKKCL